MNVENQFIVVNGQKVPLSVYMSGMNRKQRRAFLVDLKKTHKKVKRVDNPPEIPNSETKDSIENLAEVEEVKVP